MIVQLAVQTRSRDVAVAGGKPDIPFDTAKGDVTIVSANVDHADVRFS